MKMFEDHFDRRVDIKDLLVRLRGQEKTLLPILYCRLPARQTVGADFILLVGGGEHPLRQPVRQRFDQ